MAIDTTTKKYSILGAGVGLPPMPSGDSVVSEDDKKTMLGLYSGLTLFTDAPPEITTGGRDLYIRQISDFYIKVFNPLYASDFQVYPVTPRITRMQMRTKLPGGYDALSVGLALDSEPKRGFTLPTPIGIQPFSHVELFAGLKTIFEGRVSKRVRSGNGVVGFTARGYGVWATSDNFYQYQSDLNVTGSVAMRDSISRISALNVMQIDNMSASISLSQLHNMTFKQIVDKLETLEDRNGIYDFYVYNQRAAYFKLRVPPTYPHYHIPFDDSIQWEDDYEGYFSSAAIEYGSGETSEIVSRPSNIALDGLDRVAILKAPSTDGYAAAQAFRDYYLEQATTTFDAIKITRSNGIGLTTFGGSEKAPYLTLASEWVKIGNESPVIIIDTSYDFTTKALTISANRVMYSDIRNALRAIAEDAGKRRAGIDPVTRSRVRL